MTKKVLFIDDQIDLWGNAFQEELGQFDFDIRCEDNPSKALGLISSCKPHAVLLDILFPGGPPWKAHPGKNQEKSIRIFRLS